MSFYLKDPGARIDYAIDWGPAYLDGQVIAASDWTVTPAEASGVAIDISSHDLTRTAVTLTGGVPGHVYRIGNRVTLSDGRSDERSLTLRVEER
ncbi:MAG: hypothetical protein AB7O91_10385 [Sphingomonas sp.]